MANPLARVAPRATRAGTVVAVLQGTLVTLVFLVTAVSGREVCCSCHSDNLVISCHSDNLVISHLIDI